MVTTFMEVPPWTATKFIACRENRDGSIPLGQWSTFCLRDAWTHPCTLYSSVYEQPSGDKLDSKKPHVEGLSGLRRIAK